MYIQEVLAIKLGSMNKGLWYKSLRQVLDVAPPRVSCSGYLTLLKKFDEPSEAGSLVTVTFLHGIRVPFGVMSVGVRVGGIA